MTPRATLLTGGEVIDGTGAPARRADVLIAGDRVAAVGTDLDTPDGAHTIDVTGRVVAPGFVDIHSHADISVLAFPSADSALRQGITTVVTGNCGGGVAPLAAGSRHAVASVAFGYDPAWDVDVDWTSFGDYAARLDGAGVNLAPLVAHGVIRNAAMGLDQREASAAEIAAMRSLLAEALDDGAFGMSTGLEYQPGVWASPDELRTLVADVGARGLAYATHMRDRAAGHADATAEAISTALGTGAHVQLSHFAPRPNAPAAAREAAFRHVASAVESGQAIGIDTFPEVWGPALLIDLLPPWALDGTTADVLARLRHRDDRARIEDHFTATPRFLALIAGYEHIYISDTPGHLVAPGTSLSELAAANRSSIAVACMDLLAAAGDDYRTVAVRHIYATDADLERTLAMPCCSIASDGIITSGEGHECAMRWSASTYGYAARTLEQFVRATGFFTLADAVHRMTALPARQIGLRERGEVRAGWFADLTVVDPATVSDRTTPDDMARHPIGIDHVFVNGRLAVSNGSTTAERHGRTLRP